MMKAIKIANLRMNRFDWIKLVGFPFFLLIFFIASNLNRCNKTWNSSKIKLQLTNVIDDILHWLMCHFCHSLHLTFVFLISHLHWFVFALTIMKTLIKKRTTIPHSVTRAKHAFMPQILVSLVFNPKRTRPISYSSHPTISPCELVASIPRYWVLISQG